MSRLIYSQISPTNLVPITQSVIVNPAPQIVVPEISKPLPTQSVVTQSPSVQRTSRIEYVPYETSRIEYQPVQKIDYIPVEKKEINYYAIEHQTEVIPQITQEKYIEYIPKETVYETVDYHTVETKIVHQPQPQPQPIITQSIIAPPIQTSYVSTPFISQIPFPMTYSTYSPVVRGTTTSQYIPSYYYHY